jgi:UDP-N-acetylglucosamine--N-acetylmuramyl-(pentapeptide) pyrophosphoryl-undecaprenol N-acetylglucosamine transferase
VIAGGGTAGHIAPSIAIADRLRDAGSTVEFVGTSDGQEAALVPAAGYAFHPVAAAPLRRELSLRTAIAPLVAIRAVGRAAPHVEGAGAVLGMGGYASIGAVLAARRAKIPVVLHEQNAVPGLANRVLARVATAIAITFRSSRTRFPPSVRIEATGIPLRRSVLEVPARRTALAEEAGRALGLAPGRTTALVTGGSQGALHLDRTVAGAIPLLADRADLQLLVLTGPAHEDVVRPAARVVDGLAVTVVPFLPRMELALAVADLAVSRAGASSVHELAACGIPAILVPYPHATAGHQEANARELQRVGGAEVLLDRDLTAERLAEHVVALVDDERRRTRMSERARSWSTPDADRRVAELILEVAS